MELEFKAATCECGEVLFDGMWHGVVRVKCRSCGVRAWLLSDGAELMFWTADSAPRRLVSR